MPNCVVFYDNSSMSRPCIISGLKLATITPAKSLYTNNIHRLYKVISSIVNLRQNEIDLSNYVGQISS